MRCKTKIQAAMRFSPKPVDMRGWGFASGADIECGGNNRIGEAVRQNKCKDAKRSAAQNPFSFIVWI